VQTPTLVTFWTSSCVNCRQELTDLVKHRSEYDQANLSVVAVCLDGLDKSSPANHEPAAAANTFLREIEFPFPSADTTPETVERIRRFQNVLFSKYPPFVVPLSFLVDAEGQVVSIYRGSFPWETFLQDRALVDLEDEALRMLATPLAGTWFTKPATRSQFAEFVGARLIAQEPHAALRYFEAAIKSETDPGRQRVLREQAQQLRELSPAP
jgi:peroxiredoxin